MATAPNNSQDDAASSVKFTIDVDREKHTRETFGGIIPLFILSFVFIVLRVYTRLYIVKKVRIDDYLICIGWLFSLGIGVSCYLGVKYGSMSGRPIESLSPSLMSLGYVSGAFFWFYKIPVKVAAGMSYISGFKSTKLKTSVWVTVFFGVAAALIGTVGSVVFAVNDPLLVPSTEDELGYRAIIFITAGALDIITTFMMVLVPLPWLHQLSLNETEKFLMSFLIAAGGFVSSCAVVSLNKAHESFSNPGSAHHFLGLVLWGSLKTHFAISCVCALALRPFLRHHFPKYFTPRIPNKDIDDKNDSQKSIKRGDSANSQKFELKSTRGALDQFAPRGSIASASSGGPRTPGLESNMPEFLSDEQRRDSLEDIMIYSRGREAMNAPVHGALPLSPSHVETTFIYPQWGHR